MNSARRRTTLVFALATAAALLLTIGAPAQSPAMPKSGIVCTTGPSFDLYTTSGHIQTPDSNSIFMWGYSTDPGHFQTPGPVLCVNQGDTVSVTLHNSLGEKSSIVFPGQENVSVTGGSPAPTNGVMTQEAAASGGTITYTFTPSRPGTYLYESGTDPSKQVEMGLYGALVVRPSLGANYAYNSTSTRFDPDREYLLLLMEVDPDLHHAVEFGGTYDFTKVHNRYFAVNGREFPDTIQDNGSSLLPNQPYGSLVRLQPTDIGHPEQNTLVRILNAGDLNHPFHPHGNHFREIAQDGRLFSSFTERFGETVASGQTQDYLLRWDNKQLDSLNRNQDWNPNTNPLPVAQPNYRNLTFKDGVTWYAGNPYLGYKGTLPTGTTSLNICGEWYFPLHSHALDEFTNFDEGFGGMATLMRVDPRGGCFVFPASTKITAGSLNSGSVGNLAVDDSSYYKVNSTTSGTRTSDWYGQFSGIPAGSKSLQATYKGNATLVPPAAISQNFNSLSGGTSSSLPTGWALAESGTGANTTYTGNNGSSATPNTYSYGTGGERAFGLLRGNGANTFNSFIGAAFTNTTGATITSLAISYNGEQWRKAGNGADTLQFEYSTDATSLTTGTWTPVAALDFTSPQTSAGATNLNGNLAANRTAKSATITSLSIANGATYRIRWSEPTRATAHDGLAVDDFSLTPGVAAPTFPTTMSIWNWTTSSWVSLDSGNVGATDVTLGPSTAPAAPVAGSWASYIGTGGNKGVVRVRILTTGTTANFITGGNLMKLVYDAP
jgi:FtsP/CotA-like multicopper oxidase with cupredoxin domain